MRVFLTGASGFLGRVVLDRLLREKHEVVALSRSTTSDNFISKIGAIPVRGDLSDVEPMQKHLKGIDVVIHCAATVEFWGKWEKFEKGIVTATIKLAELANRNGVKRFIHISSESVLQDKAPLIDIDEKYPYPSSPNSYYGKAKKQTEEFLLKTNFPMAIIILRPTFIWGNDSNAFATIALKVKSGQFAWIDDGKADFEAIHVENVAEAILLALTNGKNRAVYLVTDDERSTVKEFFSKVFEAYSLPMPTKSLPSIIAKPAACIVETV